MPNKARLALCMFIILEEHGALPTEEHHEPPEEQKSKNVKRPQSCHSAQVEFAFARG